MRMSQLFFACLVLVGVVLAQDSAQRPNASTTDTNLAGEVQALREALSQTQKQVVAQASEIQTLKAQSKAGTVTTATGDLSQVDNESRTYDLASPGLGTANNARQVSSQDKSEKSPTGSFKFDNAVLELGGFVDFENVFRTTNTQNNIATAFGAIPFSNTPQGQITEFRTTAQYSRFDVKFAGNFEGNQITAYLETDFSGNDAPNVYQTVNSTTQRLRLYFADVKRGKWEFLGGQT